MQYLLTVRIKSLKGMNSVNIDVHIGAPRLSAACHLCLGSIDNKTFDRINPFMAAYKYMYLIIKKQTETKAISNVRILPTPSIYIEYGLDRRRYN